VNLFSISKALKKGFNLSNNKGLIISLKKGTTIKEIDVKKFHEMIGHCDVGCLKTANIHGLKFKREFKVCEEFAVAKARQSNVNKDRKGGSQETVERVYLEISSIKGESYSGSCFWALVVDDYIDYC
jgi:hypothetical protein